eukprot:TRINITY_DN8025_c0_g1_i1.p1 TRINITY_DN8025_c0_g1~~TRINITY_DN8025_c0_g1_i1.p1  ORF type:complete len:331 (-),score=69.31 TRINITY_DN8025_c0_g1_i1:108-968(-)
MGFEVNKLLSPNTVYSMNAPIQRVAQLAPAWWFEGLVPRGFDFVPWFIERARVTHQPRENYLSQLAASSHKFQGPELSKVLASRAEKKRVPLEDRPVLPGIVGQPELPKKHLEELPLVPLPRGLPGMVGAPELPEKHLEELPLVLLPRGLPGMVGEPELPEKHLEELPLVLLPRVLPDMVGERELPAATVSSREGSRFGAASPASPRRLLRERSGEKRLGPAVSSVSRDAGGSVPQLQIPSWSVRHQTSVMKASVEHVGSLVSRVKQFKGLEDTLEALRRRLKRPD